MNIKELKEYIKDLPNDMEVNASYYFDEKLIKLTFGKEKSIVFKMK